MGNKFEHFEPYLTSTQSGRRFGVNHNEYIVEIDGLTLLVSVVYLEDNGPFGSGKTCTYAEWDHAFDLEDYDETGNWKVVDLKITDETVSAVTDAINYRRVHGKDKPTWWASPVDAARFKRWIN